jgi:hypothetical protein
VLRSLEEDILFASKMYGVFFSIDIIRLKGAAVFNLLRSKNYLGVDRIW